ncbi:MAG: glycosyltransferase family 2 protein [Verrucomicrobiia bacterium]|jgi:glycosyltransferase involved in cell wall biosynthesis
MQTGDNEIKEIRILSVIIPVYNEQDTIRDVIKKVQKLYFVKDIIVIDDGSTDNTTNIINEIKRTDPKIIILTHKCNKGKGAAIKTGLPAATGKIIVIQDGDLEYNPDDFEKMLAPILSGKCKVVYGTRYGSIKAINETKIHRLGNWLLTKFANICTGQKLTDESTCYKMFKADLIKQIKLEEDDFGFCPEVTAKISNMGEQIYEVPIRYNPRNKKHGKKIRMIDGIKALWCLLKYSILLK